MFQLVSEGYAQTLGLRLTRGRMLSSDDVIGARKVAVINQTLVKRYFGPEDPLGRQVRLKMLETLPNGPVANAAVRDRRRDRGREEQRHPGSAAAGGADPLHDDRRIRARHPGPDRGRAGGAC